MRHHEQLACCIDVAALVTLAVPCVADFHPLHSGHDVVVATAAQHLASGCVRHRESKPVASLTHS